MLLLAGCADRFAAYEPLPGAVQQPHRQAMPQIGRDGRRRDGYDAGTALLPLALSGALVDYSNGVRFGFRAAYEAGFNAVLPDPGQPPATVRTAAAGSHLLVLADAAKAGADDTVTIDARPVLLVPVRDAGDLAPLAASLRQHPDRPVWALLRAFADRTAGETLPRPGEAALLAFGALACGAGGLVWQGEDNYAARNAGFMGIAATPSLDYGIRTAAAGTGSAGREPYRASPDDIAAARRLWDAVTVLNRRIEKLAPMLLRSDAAERYDLAVGAGDDGSGLRALLKPWGDAGDPRRLLLVVNAAAQATGFRIGFEHAFSHVERWQEEDPDAAPPDTDAARGLLRDRIDAMGVRLYRITLPGVTP